MSAIAKIRELLIESCHSSASAAEFFDRRLSDAQLLECLIQIARDEEDYNGDSPMEAAYYASRFPVDMLAPYETTLLETLDVAEDRGYAGHVALALGKLRSPNAKDFI